MKTNQLKLLKFQAIDRTIRQYRGKLQKKLTAKILAREIADYVFKQSQKIIDPPAVSTVKAHISEMKRDYNAPIVYSVKNNCYYYTDPGYQFDTTPTQEEWNAVNKSLALLNEFSGLHLGDALRNLLLKLEQQLKIERASDTKYGIVQFDQAPAYKGMKWLPDLIQACQTKQKIGVTYHAFKPDEVELYVVSPFFIREYNNRWYLIAYDNRENMFRHLAFDRIVKIQPSLQPGYFIPEGYTPATYFANIIGVTFQNDDTQIYDVIIKTNAEQANYIRTKPLHHTQQEKSDNSDNILFSIRVKLNYELEMQLLQFGERIEVLAPEVLRIKMLSRLTAARENYL